MGIIVPSVVGLWLVIWSAVCWMTPETKNNIDIKFKPTQTNEIIIQGDK